jgi:hypothetical protein
MDTAPTLADPGLARPSTPHWTFSFVDTHVEYGGRPWAGRIRSDLN